MMLARYVAMRRSGVTVRWFGVVAAFAAMWSSIASGQVTAATPPMGWNSWDSYGTTVNETQVKANADWMAKHLKASGWSYIVVDMEWYVKNPVASGNAKNSEYAIDAYGRYVPAENRFPSSAAGAGFGPLAAYVHGLGLRFGIHILQGVPKIVAGGNATIEGSALRAADAANQAGTCAWNFDNYDVKDDAAGQAYYDSLMRLYAGWGVDLIKVDCIASRPYKGAEIAMIGRAIAKAGRPMVLSLSPGEAPMNRVPEMRAAGAAMWRISDDVWDLWHSDVAYPQGLGDQIPRLARWAGRATPGHWPDADMLPVGYLGPNPGWGKARETRLTHEEQRTLLTMWAMFRSPLMVGGDLTRMDAWTEGLLTDPEVIMVDQTSSENRPVDAGEGLVVWVARGDGDTHYVAVVNTSETAREFELPVEKLGWKTGTYRLRDLWARQDVGEGNAVKGKLESHASVLYRAQRR